MVLQSLLQCKNRSQYHHIISATQAILFFGTPHQGMEVEELCNMVQDVSPRAISRLEILRQLEEGSIFLNTQRDDITNLWDSACGIEILSFYGTRKTMTVRKVDTGEYSLSVYWC